MEIHHFSKSNMVTTTILEKDKSEMVRDIRTQLHDVIPDHASSKLCPTIH